MKNLLGTKHFVATLVVAFFTVINAFGQKPNTFFITADDQIHYLYGDKMTFSGKFFSYVGENGKDKVQLTEDVKLLFTGNRVSIGLPYSSHNKNSKKLFLHRLIAFNSKYLLLMDNSGEGFASMICIVDRENRGLQKFVNTSFGKEVEYIDIYYNKVKLAKEITIIMNKYFPECPDLLEKQLKNLENKAALTKDINYYNCGNAPDFFSNKIEEKVEEGKETYEEVKNYISTTIGNKLTVDRAYLTSSEFVKYYDRPGVTGLVYLKSIDVKDIRFLKLDEKIYQPFKTAKNKLNMMEVIVYSDKTILVCDSKEKYSVYDRNNVLITNDIEKEALSSVVQKYFPNCKEIVSIIEENIKLHRKATSGLTNINCNNAPALITE